MRPAVRKTIRRTVKPQQLWSITATLTSPNTPGARRLMMNTPLTENDFATPDDHRHYRPACMGTPLTPLTPLDSLRRSARIASRTPTSLRERDPSSKQKRRATPKRIKLNSSPVRFLRDLDSLTNQFSQQLGKGSLSMGVSVYKAISTDLSETINRQDSCSKLPEIPVIKPTAKPEHSTDSKENELEPRHRIRLRHSRGVFVSQTASDAQMLTGCFE